MILFSFVLVFKEAEKVLKFKKTYSIKIERKIYLFSDTCQGDSGGPLMMFSNSQWILVGITSYGAGCGLADHPGVYTRVSYYQNWISCFLTDNTSCVENTTSKEMFIPSVGSSIFYKNICVFFLGFALLKSGVCHR
jgi:secreted trypsin-like serine protease